ncbi:MAG: glycosyltransferase [Sulfuricella sp.]|nr:glycosyltransferase [Sulfuricella sp.]
MNIIYINGWSISDQLTISTTFPSLKVLSQSSIVDEVIFVTPEEVITESTIEYQKTSHIGVPLGVSSIAFLSYFLREVKFFIRLLQICKERKVDLIFARGAPSGGRASWLAVLTRLPFIVESFEPHSQYMRDSGVWCLYDPRFLLQRLWEHCAIKRALALLTVSNNFAISLRNRGVEHERIIVLPCTVDIEMFRFNNIERSRVRQELEIPDDAIVGIYVGKFGGIYFDLIDAIRIFSEAFSEFNNFYLIILSNESRERIDKAIEVSKAKLDSDRILVFSVSHSLVPGYLSAADFAYALIREGPSKRFCSPTKVGEYWANGLPVIIPNGIGDDSGIILDSGLGVVIGDVEGWSYCHRLMEILSRSEHRSEITGLARQNRSADLIAKVYRKLGF